MWAVFDMVLLDGSRPGGPVALRVWAGVAAGKAGPVGHALLGSAHGRRAHSTLTGGMPCDSCHRRRWVSAGREGAPLGMSSDKAAQAREGLSDSLAGKAKEVAGAVSGKDDLVE